MQSFKDKSGLPWDIKFGVLLRRTIRQRVGVDIVALLATKTLKKLDEETELWVDIIWACVEKQANERSITMEQFFDDDNFDEDLLETVVDLCFDESVIYAPEKKRAMLRKTLSIYRQTGKRTIDTLMKHIDDIDESAAVDAMVSEIENSLQLRSIPGKTISLEALESPQTTEVSES